MTLPRRTPRAPAASLRRSRVYALGVIVPRETARAGRRSGGGRSRACDTAASAPGPAGKASRQGRHSHIGTGRNIPRVVEQSHRCHMGGCRHSPLQHPSQHLTPPSTARRSSSSSRQGRQECTGTGTLLPYCHAHRVRPPLDGTFRQESDVWVFQRLFGGPYVNTPTYINKDFSYIWVPRIDLRAKFKLHTHPKPPPTCAFTQNLCGSLFSPFPPKPSILRNLHSTVTRN